MIRINKKIFNLLLATLSVPVFAKSNNDNEEDFIVLEEYPVITDLEVVRKLAKEVPDDEKATANGKRIMTKSLTQKVKKIKNKATGEIGYEFRKNTIVHLAYTDVGIQSTCNDPDVNFCDSDPGSSYIAEAFLGAKYQAYTGYAKVTYLEYRYLKYDSTWAVSNNWFMYSAVGYDNNNNPIDYVFYKRYATTTWESYIPPYANKYIKASDAEGQRAATRITVSRGTTTPIHLMVQNAWGGDGWPDDYFPRESTN